MSASRTNARNLTSLSLFGMAVLAALVIARIPAAHAYSGSNHESITRLALPFLVDDVLDTIVYGNANEDVNGPNDKAEDEVWRHSQNCTFSRSAQYINDRYSGIDKALRHPSSDTNKPVRLFGHITHGIQDFYSHSNYIPSPPEGLGIRDRIFNNELTLWPVRPGFSTLFNDVKIIEGPPPPGMIAVLPRDSRGRATSAVPIITAGGATFRGLMTSVSGNVANYPQLCPPVRDACVVGRSGGRPPEALCLRHSDRDFGDGNKTFSLSKPGNFNSQPPPPRNEGRMNMDGDGGGDWSVSREFAKRQTQHEWCRLLHLSRNFDPSFAESGLILGTWVKKDVPGATPHIPNTPCERRLGPHLIEVSATPAANAGATMQFVVFRANFKDSAHTQVNANATAKLSVCASDDDTIAASVSRWNSMGPTMHFKVSAIRQTTVASQGSGLIRAAFDVKMTANGCVGGRPTSGPTTDSIRTGAGLCLDLHSSDTTKDGGRVQAWGCHGRANQLWTYDRASRAIRAASGRCLDVDLPQMRTNGGRVQTWSCNGQSQQQWTPLPNGGLRNGGGLCLDVHAPDQHKNGGRVQVWACNGGQQQRFSSGAF